MYFPSASENTMEELDQDKRFPGRDSKQVPQEYRSSSLPPLQPARSLSKQQVRK
jgi:hypothetical protein